MSHRKIPATVITGFLGAGKTTLIRHLLGNADGRRIGLIINEFGDVGIDGEIVKACGDAYCREENVVELANGCICCTVADDFIPAMTAFLDRDQPPEHVVIETSGLALPQPLIRAFNWPEIGSRVTVDGVVTVVDGAAVAAGRFATDEAAVAAARRADPNLDHDSPIEELFEDQLRCADMVLVNKADVLGEAGLSAVKAQLRDKVRPATRLVATEHGRVAVTALLGLAAEAEADMAARPSHHELEGEAVHDHDDFESFVVSLGPIGDRRSVLSRIAAVLSRHDILRLKGFLAVGDAPSRLLVQAVGPRLDAYFDRPWRQEEKRVSRLVVIGLKGLDREAIAAGLNA